LLRADFCRSALFFCVKGVQGCHCFSWELSLACRAPGTRAKCMHSKVLKICTNVALVIVRELELELIQSHMAQKPMLRGEVGARALRVRSDVRGHGQVRLCKALGCGRCGCLKPIRACCVVGSAFFLVAPPRGGCAMAPRDSGMCWKQFMMCLEEIQFVAGVHSPPMHDPGLEEFQRPVRVCECKGASVLPCLLSCCCWRRRPPAARRSRLRAAPPPGACPPESPWCRPVGDHREI